MHLNTKMLAISKSIVIKIHTVFFLVDFLLRLAHFSPTQNITLIFISRVTCYGSFLENETGTQQQQQRNTEKYTYAQEKCLCKYDADGVVWKTMREKGMKWYDNNNANNNTSPISNCMANTHEIFDRRFLYGRRTMDMK